MIILHLANISNINYSGKSIVVPKYVKYQSKHVHSYLINLNNEVLKSISIENYQSVSLKDGINCLKEPFDNPDLIIIHGIYDLQILIYFLIHVRKRMKYIAIPHGGLQKESQKKSKIKKTIANLFFYKSYFKHAEAIQFLSDIEKQSAIYNFNNAIVAGNGIELNERNLYSIKDRAVFKLVYVGRLDIYYKGLDLMLKATKINKVFMQHNHIILYLYGIDYCNSYKELMNYIELNELQDIIKIDKNGIFDKHKHKILLDSDYFIQTSRSEGFSVGVIEAMGLGIPLIVTEGVGINGNEKSINFGFLCKNSVESIAEKIREAYDLSNDSSLKNLSDNAFEAAKIYDWNCVTKTTIEKYMELLDETNS